MGAIFDAFDDGLQLFARVFGQSASAYCDLEANENANVLAASDGSLVSMIEVGGIRRIAGRDEIEAMCHRIDIGLSSLLDKPGHSLQFCFIYDPDPQFGLRDLDASITALKRGASSLGLDATEILNDRREKLASLITAERCFIGVWTHPGILERELKDANKDNLARMKTFPNGKKSMRYGVGLGGLIDEHESIVESLIDRFGEVDVVLRRLSAHEACRAVRREIDEAYTDDQWEPRLLGDPFPIRFQDSGPPDISDIMHPPLYDQLIPREPERITSKIVEIGNRCYLPISMTLGPREPQTFQELLNMARKKGLPWRMRMLVSGGGVSSLTYKQIAASVMLFAGQNNKDIDASIKALNLYEGAVVGLRADFATWVEGSTDEDLEQLKRRGSQLSRMLQAWGGLETSDVTGNPVEATLCSVPNLLKSSVSPVSAPPLSDVVPMLPLSRPCSPWETGNMLFRTPDGLLWPYKAYSDIQDAWVTLISAPMGGGKSVLMNALNTGLLFDADNDVMPYIRIADIGASSEGTILMAQEMLPASQQHLAVFRRLLNTADQAINPFDTPLGCRLPLDNHREFLRGLLTTMATPPGADSRPHEFVPGMVGKVIDIAYANLSDSEGGGREYSPGLDADLDRAIEEHQLDLPEESVRWWDIVDAFFDRQEYRWALRAQAYAVPTLDDVIAACQDPKVTDIYSGTTVENESFSKALWRMLLESREAYPVLSAATKFDLGDARLVSLDLEQVCPRGSQTADKQTAIMYLAALWKLTGELLIKDDIIGQFPEKYRDYHLDRIKGIMKAKKRICADEVHRSQRVASVGAALTEFVREGRKNAVEVVLGSQLPKDFPSAIIELATCFFVLGKGTSGAKEICKAYEMSETAGVAIDHRLRGPTAKGSNIVAKFVTKAGTYEHLLTLSIGSRELWSFSTTQADRAIRTAFYTEFGPVEGRRFLAKRFPGGSAAKEIKRRTALRALPGVDEDEVKEAVRDELIRELLAEARQHVSWSE